MHAKRWRKNRKENIAFAIFPYRLSDAWNRPTCCGARRNSIADRPASIAENSNAFISCAPVEQQAFGRRLKCPEAFQIKCLPKTNANLAVAATFDWTRTHAIFVQLDVGEERAVQLEIENRMLCVYSRSKLCR